MSQKMSKNRPKFDPFLRNFYRHNFLNVKNNYDCYALNSFFFTFLQRFFRNSQNWTFLKCPKIENPKYSWVKFCFFSLPKFI